MVIYRLLSQTALRDVAQLGRALRSGRRGRRFKSCHFDYLAGAPKALEIRLSVFFCVGIKSIKIHLVTNLVTNKIPGRETSLTSIVSNFLHPGIPSLYFIVFVFSLFNPSPYILFRFTLLLQLLRQVLHPTSPDICRGSVSGSCLSYRN